MEVQHATGRRPFEHGDVSTSTEDRHHDGLQRQLQANSAIPGYEEWIFVDELPTFALGKALVVLNAFDLGDDADNAIPMVALRSQRAEETWHVAKVVQLPVRLNLDLPYRHQYDLT